MTGRRITMSDDHDNSADYREQVPIVMSWLNSALSYDNVEVSGESGTEAAGGRACQWERPRFE
jgi:hypothetical protein